MQPLHRVTANELATIQMENELLRYEVQHLRARLAECSKSAPSTESADVQASGAASEAADQTRDDLVWLLNRIDDLPVAGATLRRRPGIRRLRERYLGASHA